MKKTLLLAAASVALAQAVSAATQTLPAANNPVNPAFTATDYSGSFNVPKFNTVGGTLVLTGVSLKITGDGRSQITNNGQQADTFGGNFTVAFTISGFGGGPFANNTIVNVPNVLLNPAQSTPFGTGSANGSVNVTGGLAGWADAAGVGTVPIGLAVSTVGIALTGTGGNGGFLTQGQGTLEVTYTYNRSDVPEPSFYGAMGALVCFGLLGYRQYRAKQNA